MYQMPCTEYTCDLCDEYYLGRPVNSWFNIPTGTCSWDSRRGRCGYGMQNSECRSTATTPPSNMPTMNMPPSAAPTALGISEIIDFVSTIENTALQPDLIRKFY